MSAARMRGISRSDGAHFSILLSIPTILGAGTLATALAAPLLAGFGLGLGLFDLSMAGVVAAAGLAGALIDSLLGASFERRGLLDNEAPNCLATLAGAWLAARAAHYLLGPAFGS